jgi:hypothetical protein
MVKLSIVSGTLLFGMLAGCATAATPLLDQQGLGDFELVTTPAATPDSVWSLRPDGVLAVAGKPSGFFATRASYANYRLHAEWRWPGKPGNGGVLLHVASGPKDGVWPLSVQVQTKHGFAGDLLPMAGASFTEPLTTAPGAYPPIKGHAGADSEKPAGEWNSMDVVCQDGAIEVSINGVAQNRVSGATPREGKIGFQLEGAPNELRNVTVTRLP